MTTVAGGYSASYFAGAAISPLLAHIYLHELDR